MTGKLVVSVLICLIGLYWLGLRNRILRIAFNIVSTNCGSIEAICLKQKVTYNRIARYIY